MEPETGGAPSGAEALSAGDLRNMLGQCLKLASENKITAKNTWGLPLIEHLDDLIKAEPDSTNFQRASVTLDAGVKIYGTRVDSVHTETFKILGGLGRAAAPEEALEGLMLGRVEVWHGCSAADNLSPPSPLRWLQELRIYSRLTPNTLQMAPRERTVWARAR